MNLIDAYCSSCKGERRAISAALAAAVLANDIAAAIESGLLEWEASTESGGSLCAFCAMNQAHILAARDERLRALAARERFRAREARLVKRAQARVQKRQAATNAQHLASSEKPAASLPPAAAAALARAKAKAAGRT
jgi:Na+-translocating ferredoxin:NAD+ oxidoreductase RnfC subunit